MTELRAEDLRIDLLDKSRTCGLYDWGMDRGRAIRLTHIPTGLNVSAEVPEGGSLIEAKAGLVAELAQQVDYAALAASEDDEDRSYHEAMRGRRRDSENG